MPIRTMQFALVSSAVVSFHVAPLMAQQGEDPVPRQLETRGIQEHPALFTGVKSVASLPDGRVVVADPLEGRIALLDFKNRSERALGREGSGPKEYRSLGGVYRASGGQVAVYDQGLQRYLLVSTSGELLGERGVKSAFSGTAASDSDHDQAIPDTLGTLFTAVVFGKSQEAFPVVRINANGTRVSVGSLQPPKMVEVPSGQANVVLRQLVYFSPADVWAVSPDGWLVTASASPYQVRWYPPTGDPVTGPVLPFTKLPITKVDRDAVSRAQAANPPPQIGSIGKASQAPRQTDPLFAEFKPPFSKQIPVIDAQGRLWLRRHAAAGVRGTVYDVIDRRGQRTERFLLPPDTRLVGADATWLYGVRKDADDFLHLFRVAAP